MTTVTVTRGSYLVTGMQLRRRRLVPRWFGDLVLWMFFHRLDSSTEIDIFPAKFLSKE